ncbi:MAG: hypothetical protein GY880_01665, partial [Planctomycetaceae bacterium]|nr:hypothetical protein [Planctomycetaceae bacterium]
VRAAYVDINPSASGVEFRSMVLLSPFVVSDETHYQLLFVPFGDGFRAELRTKHSNASHQWTSNFKAEIQPLEQPTVLDAEILEKFDELKKQPLESSQPLDWAGPRWHCDWVGEGGDDSIVTRVRIPEGYAGEIDEYFLHPALLDRSIHNAMNHLVGFLIPFSCDSCRIYGNLPAETYTYAARSEAGTGSGCNLVIADVLGNVLVELDNYMLRSSDNAWGNFGTNITTEKDHQMVIEKIGSLNSFEQREVFPLPLKPSEVRISIAATGLNFRDVLCA